MAVLKASVRRFQDFQDLMKNVNWHEGTKYILKFNMINMESNSQAHFQFSKSYFIKYSYCRMIPVNICQILITVLPSIDSPSMVDPQWNTWYWGSKWNLHTVCWCVVGLEWITTSVYFGITYVCFIPSRLPVFAVEAQYLLQDFLFLSKVSFDLHIQSLQKNFMLV